jgi:hypothetical protein
VVMRGTFTDSDRLSESLSPKVTAANHKWVH